MKKIVLFLALALMIGCKSKKATVTKPEEPVITKVAATNINPEIREKAHDLGRRVLMTCNISKFKPFNASEATQTVINNMTKERLTKTCLKFRLKYGDFKDLELVEVFKNRSEKTTVFRYKALYEKKIANKELRLTMNDKNQLSSVKSLDWTDAYQKKQPKVQK